MKRWVLAFAAPAVAMIGQLGGIVPGPASGAALTCARPTGIERRARRWRPDKARDRCKRAPCGLKQEEVPAWSCSTTA